MWFTVGAARRVAIVKGVEAVAVIDPTGTRKVVSIRTIDTKWDRKCISKFLVPAIEESVPLSRKRVWANSKQPLMAAAMVSLFLLGLFHTPFRV